MSDKLKFPTPDDSDSLGEPLVSLVREAYTPPDAAGFGDVYWTRLESRIMSRVTAESGERAWWSEFFPWARVGIAAVVGIFMLAGIVNGQLSEPEQVAYEVITDVDVASASDEPIASQYLSRDASGLSYYLSN